MTNTPRQSIYDLIGGEPTVKKIVNHFYEVMSNNPDFKTLRDMHPVDISSSVEKLYLFLTGWLGGPQLYFEKHGHPRLRARHLPFKIGKQERDHWMLCMVQAFEEAQVQEPYRTELLNNLLNLADHMRNQPEL